jgi:hypothetical protein
MAETYRGPVWRRGVIFDEYWKAFSHLAVGTSPQNNVRTSLNLISERGGDAAEDLSWKG